MNQQEFLQLLNKYLDGSASREEEELLFRFYNQFQEGAGSAIEVGRSQEMEERMLHRLQQAIAAHGARVVPLYHRTWFKVAAVVLLVLWSGLFWLNNKGNPQHSLAANEPVLPPLQVDAVQKVTLTLDNGTKLALDTLANGFLLQQGSTIIEKEEGRLVYRAVEKSKTPAGLNQITTPKGAQFKVVLPDGSMVWLNAASTLRFPTAFGASERRVQVSGEAYFEVAKEATRPFRVYALGNPAAASNGTVVEVLGTHFNVNAYADEHTIKTTLVEGKVKVIPVNKENAHKSTGKVLAPGQQAQSGGDKAPDSIEVKSVDVKSAVAWTSNFFDFNQAGIETIMRQLARWYDVEVVYEGAVAPRSFSGKISRNAALETVLKILEQSNIHFQIQGKKIRVRS